MQKTVAKYGIIAGVIVSSLMLISMSMMGTEHSDMTMGQYVGYTFMLLSFTTIFIGIKSYRNNELGGSITFGKAFWLGLLIALVASTIYALSWVLLSDVIAPNFMETYTAAMTTQMQADGMSAEAIAVEVESMEMWAEYYKNPIIKLLFTYMEILPVGILVSIVSALILKKK